MHKQTYRYEAIKYPSNEDVFFNVLWHNRDYTAPHWHNGLEILYLLEGSEDCYLGEEECIRMKKGDFLVINSRVVHSVQCPPLPGRALPPMIHSDFFISSLFYTVPGQRCKPSFLFFSAGLLSPQKNSGVPTNAAVLST